jgi:uncharacterized protein (DUF2132 family)
MESNELEPKKGNKDPLHGVTLKEILSSLEKQYGWERMGEKVNIRCFNYEPSISSSLKFLRKTPWARAKVEEMYLDMIQSPWFRVAEGSQETES